LSKGVLLPSQHKWYVPSRLDGHYF
jgi:hypothetical protein